MDKQLPVLQVQLFGKEKITYGDTPVLYGRNAVTKAMKLLFILLCSGEKGIARNRLLESLYGRDELANASNSLRVTTHRLKKTLVELGLPEHEYIVSKKGIYYWDSPMKTEVDAVQFELALEQAKNINDPEEKADILQKAIAMYKGEFFEKCQGDDWVMIESLRYKDMYFDAVSQVIEYLMSQREYAEVLKIVDPVCEMYPFDEWQSVKIDCYIAMNLYKEALKEYENTAKMLVEELGVSPSEKMIRQFREMSEHISNRPQNIREIKAGLQENEIENGAFFCTVPGFRDVYRSVRRGMERSGQSVFLLVCTLTDSQGHPLENSKKLDEMSEGLFYAIKSSLRRTDSFTKYNASQYLVLLMGTNEENCQIVIDRIMRSYGSLHKSWVNHLSCGVSSLYDME